MDDKHSTKENILLSCLYLLFALYIVFLLRITLFKQASLYNLLAAIGASERTINIIPLWSIVDMASSSLSIKRMMENILGNVVIFIPLGLLLPVIFKRESRDILLGGVILSASIEIIQLIFGLGSTDIDDFILNMLGAMLGYWLFKVIKEKAASSFALLSSMVALLTVSGTIVFSVLLVNHTDLLVIFPKKMVVENAELVQAFVDTPHDLSGKLVEVKDSTLVVEKSVQIAAEPKKSVELQLTADSHVYICYHEIDYFFSSISREHQRYEQIAYADFITNKSDAYKKNNVRIWSSDGETIDNLVVVEWVK